MQNGKFVYQGHLIKGPMQSGVKFHRTTPSVTDIWRCLTPTAVTTSPFKSFRVTAMGDAAEQAVWPGHRPRRLLAGQLRQSG